MALAMVVTAVPQDASAASKTATVASQKQLKKALANKKVKTIIISAKAKNKKLVIPKGAYSGKSLDIRAPKVTVTLKKGSSLNNVKINKANAKVSLQCDGSPKSITVSKKSQTTVTGSTTKTIKITGSAANSTVKTGVKSAVTTTGKNTSVVFTKGSDNSTINAKSNVTVTVNKDVAIKSAQFNKANANSTIKVNGSVAQVAVNKTTNLQISGSSKTPVPVNNTAANSDIKTSVAAHVTNTGNDAKVTFEKGADASTLDAQAKTDIAVAKDTKIQSVTLAAEGADCSLTLDGAVDTVKVEQKAQLDISGSNKDAAVNVAVSEAAAGSTINADVPVDVQASAEVKVNLGKGSEGSSVSTDKSNVKVDVDNQSGDTVKVETPEGSGTVDSGSNGSTTGTDSVITPTAAPSAAPSTAPSAAPTAGTSAAPAASTAPSSAPSAAPTAGASTAPAASTAPSSAPSTAPTTPSGGSSSGGSSSGGSSGGNSGTTTPKPAPEVKAVTVAPGNQSLAITFTEKVSGTAVVTLTAKTEAGGTAAKPITLKATVAADGMSLTAEADTAIPAGTYTLAVTGLKNAAGTAVKVPEKLAAVTIGEAKEITVAGNAAVDAKTKTITVTFTDAVQAEANAAVTLNKTGADAITFNKDLKLAEDKKSLTAVTEAAAIPDGEYTLSISGIKGSAGGQVTVPDAYKTVTIDTTAPAVADGGIVAKEDAKTITITFNEAIKETEAGAKVTLTAAAKASSTTPAFTVEIADKTLTATANEFITAGTYNVNISGIADASGNEVNENVGNATIQVVFDTPSITDANLTEKAAAFAGAYYNKASATTSGKPQTLNERTGENKSDDFEFNEATFKTTAFFEIQALNAADLDGIQSVSLGSTPLKKEQVKVSVGNNNSLLIPEYMTDGNKLLVSYIFIALNKAENGKMTFNVAFDGNTSAAASFTMADLTPDLTLSNASLAYGESSTITLSELAEDKTSVDTVTATQKSDFNQSAWKHLILLNFKDCTANDTYYITKRVYESGNTNYGFTKAEDNTNGALGLFPIAGKMKYHVATANRHSSREFTIVLNEASSSTETAN